MTMTFTTSTFTDSTFTDTSHQPAQIRPRVRTHAAPKAPVSINLLFAAVLGVAIIVALVVFGGDAAANSPLEPVSANSEIVDAIEVYVVQPGDTLWAIAGEIAQPGEDVRPIVDELKVITGGSQLDAGQRIVIDHTTIRG